MLRGPFEPLTIPAYAEDGGEEAEIAGVYMIGDDGTPYRIGMATGNEFSDHQFREAELSEPRGLEAADLQRWSELVIGAGFHAVAGEVRIDARGETIWRRRSRPAKKICAHSLANLEHHHFKFAGHRQPGDVHVHFFGAHSLSFGDGIVLQDGDWMEVQFRGIWAGAAQPDPRGTEKTRTV